MQTVQFSVARVNGITGSQSFCHQGCVSIWSYICASPSPENKVSGRSLLHAKTCPETSSSENCYYFITSLGFTKQCPAGDTLQTIKRAGLALWSFSCLGSWMPQHWHMSNWQSASLTVWEVRPWAHKDTALPPPQFLPLLASIHLNRDVISSPYCFVSAFSK